MTRQHYPRPFMECCGNYLFIALSFTMNSSGMNEKLEIIIFSNLVFNRKKKIAL